MSLLSTIFGGSSAHGESFEEGASAFALELYGQLKRRPGNLFFSPYSISTALSMAYAGARGETEKQMREVLHLGNAREVHSSVGQIQRQLTQAGEYVGIDINVANALWTQAGHPFRGKFLQIAQGNYQANVGQADFVREHEMARSAINDWVAQQTRQRIQNILPPGSLHPLTRLVLANAIYFDGTWQRPYERESTTQQPFYLGDAGQRRVPLMHQVDEVRYMHEADFQAVELPYRGGGIAMVVLLPRQPTGCAQLESRLSASFLSGALKQMKRREVEIFLPRFTLESEFFLNDTLASMGMPAAFGPDADFSGIDGSRWLSISGIFHKAWGDVYEEGTQAAAATSVDIAGLAVDEPPPPPPVFRADHPFIFLIRDTRSGMILFLGRLSDPGFDAM